MVEITKLENGLTIITDKNTDHTTKLSVWIKAGLINETDKENGLSHFLEHMLFKGTKTRTSQQINELIENLGGDTNAYTTIDHTCFYCNVLNKDWKTGVEFLADITQNASFPENEIEKERDVILQEIMMYKDDPSSVTYEKHVKTVFEGQALGRMVIGTENTVKSFTRDDLVAYMKNNYVANRMIFGISGNVKHKEVVEEVKKAFENVNTEYKGHSFTSLYNAKSAKYNIDFNQANVVLSYPLPGIREINREKLALLMNILSNGMSSRLFQEVREKRGLCYYVTASKMLNEDTSYLGIVAGVDKENTKLTLEVCHDVVESLKDNISDIELERAKNQAYMTLASVSDSGESRLSYAAHRLLTGMDVESFEEKEKKIAAITKEDLYSFAKEIFTDNYSMITLNPTLNSGEN